MYKYKKAMCCCEMLFVIMTFACTFKCLPRMSHYLIKFRTVDT